MRRRAATAIALACACAGLAGAPAQAAPEEQRTSDERGRTWWSEIQKTVGVRERPDRKSRRVGTLQWRTYYGRPDLAVVLEQSGTWTRVRFSGVGRRIGWVPASALSEPRLTESWVTIDKDRRVLRAYRGDQLVLSTRIGIGAPGSPTPGGTFFIRERLVPSNKRGIYGVLALGLSAYSRHRTDWPGGGQVGIHGTNQPDLIPGRISNGCIRLRNAAVTKLGRIVGPGTPVHIR